MMEKKTGVRAILILIVLLAFCQFSFPENKLLIPRAYASISNHDLADAIIWNSTPFWSNTVYFQIVYPNGYDLGQVSANYSANIHLMGSEFNVTSTVFYAYKHTFSMNITYQGQINTNAIPVGLQNIAEFLSIASDGHTYLEPWLTSSEMGSAYVNNLNLSTNYDVQDILITDNNESGLQRVFDRINLYSGGHMGESTYLLATCDNEVNKYPAINWNTGGHLLYGSNALLTANFWDNKLYAATSLLSGLSVAIQGNATSMGLGDYLTLNGTISGGSGLYTRQLLYGDGTPIWQDFIPTTSTIIANFSISPGYGNWTFKYRVDDSLGGLAFSSLWNLTVGLGNVVIDVSGDLEEIQGGFANKWVFTNWKYYTFTLHVILPYGSGGITDCGINFTVQSETVGSVAVYLIATNNSQSGFGWEYSSNLTSADQTRFGEPVLLKTGENTTLGYLTYDITFPIFFQKQCLDEWLSATSVWGACNATNAINASWQELQHNYFCIYSRGGFSLNYAHTASDAYLMAGGTPFSFYATNGTSVYNEVWYRDVQHVKLLPDVQFKTGLETWELQYGIDYVLQGNSSWQSGWMAQVNPYAVSYTGIFAGNVWINMTANFNNRGAWLGSKNLYMFYHGSVSGTGDIGHWQFWVDLWFSDTNASSAGAARINAYEYPMHDNADAWLRWLSSNWGVKDDVLKEAQIEFPLLDSDGVTPVSSGKIKMMRVWSNLTVEDNNAGQQISINNFESFDLTHSKELPLTGIPAPVFDETKVPTVGNSGILGAVFSLFSGIGQWLSENVIFGGLNLWGNFVAFLDTIAGWFGAPYFFSNLFSWIGSGIGWLGSSITYVLTLIYDVFLLLGSLMAGFLSTIGQLIMSIVNTITYFTNIMSGAIGGAGNLWDQLGLMSWLQVFLVFYPLYLLILWDEKGTDAVVAHLTIIFGILSWLFNFFYQIGILFISFISGLVESIPVVE